MPNYILYIAHSDNKYINECRFSLLKLLSVYNLNPPPDLAIAVYTDQPQLFENFIPFFKTFELLTLTPETIKAWYGSINYRKRIKLSALQDFMTTHSGNILFFETHTYITATIDAAWKPLSDNAIYMHSEAIIKQRNNILKKEISNGGDTIPYGDKLFTYTPGSTAWNTGVIGLNALQTPAIKDALLLVDALYKKYEHPQTEQIACSFCFSRGHTIRLLNEKVVQYEELKDFGILLRFFFMRNDEESIPNLVKKVHYIDARKIITEKAAFRNLPLYKKGWQLVTGQGWSIKNYLKKL